MCPVVQKAKLKMSEFGVRHLLFEKAPTEKVGLLLAPQVHLACCTRVNIFKGPEEQVGRMLVGQVSTGKS